jgi:hypothetical protein
MDKTELLISIIDRATALYEEMLDTDNLDPVEIEKAVEFLKSFLEELESLVD